MEFYPGCHIVPDVDAKSVLLIDREDVAIIDTGLPGNARKILAYLERLGRHTQDVRWIFITHADDDHYGGLANLQTIILADTWASRIEAEAIQTGGASRPLKLHPLAGAVFERFMHPRVKAMAARVDGILNDGQTFPLLGGLRAVFTPGHTPGHFSFFLEKHGILFAGDSIISRKSPAVCSAGINTWNEESAQRSFWLQAHLKPQILCCGHGPLLTDHPLDRYCEDGEIERV